MAATTGATAGNRTNRAQHVVTRHGLRSRPAATPLQRIPPSAPFAAIGAKMLSLSRSRFPILGLPAKNLTHQVPANAGSGPVWE